MDTQGFIQILQEDILEAEIDIQISTSLRDIEEWDSLAAMSVTAYIDQNFGGGITLDQVLKCETMSDIVEFVKDRLDD